MGESEPGGLCGDSVTELWCIRELVKPLEQKAWEGVDPEANESQPSRDPGKGDSGTAVYKLVTLLLNFSIGVCVCVCFVYDGVMP